MKILFVLLMASVFCAIHAGSKKEERFALVCEGGKQVIRCDKQEIDIVSAFFGRTDRKVCQSGLDWLGAWAWNVNCHAGNALEVTRGECQGLSSCELNANTAEYGEPCFGTKKYLKVTYRCIGQITAGDTKRERVCENQHLSIECPEKRMIDIVWANFGRLKGSHVCGDGFFGLFSWYQKCHNANSLATVRRECQDKEYCSLQATVSRFGDSCWGTKKYLEVRYRCCKKKGGC